jgi:hypothetical protein
MGRRKNGADNNDNSDGWVDLAGAARGMRAPSHGARLGIARYA